MTENICKKFKTKRQMILSLEKANFSHNQISKLTDTSKRNVWKYLNSDHISKFKPINLSKDEIGCFEKKVGKPRGKINWKKI